ncbi:MAG: DEAD/DEAH box helicase [Candidatus Nanopelagicales bacterium]|nr:DEAD/DEAH box helicase [Candidatus Nanopelagicales bacterium]
MNPSFTDLGVAPQFAQALARQGIMEPFAIQIATLPDAIEGRDVLARAQTGSGKTLAFGLAALTRLLGTDARPRKPLSLILVPTRELAMQVSDTLRPIAEAAGLRQRLIAGGMPYNKQLEALDRGVHMLIATPGRLMDLADRGAVDLSSVEITVLDEADQMADMGFMPIVREILDLTKPGSQRLLFSATLDGDVDAIRKAYMNSPVTHSLAPASASVDTMEHHVLLVHPMDKEVITAQIGSREGRTIFFMKTQAGVDRMADYLTSQGVAAGALHGGKTQAVRTRTLDAFKSGVTPALVATDVAARGIHVDGISLVVHVDAPRDPKDYLHRAGRTARAGESGTVVILAAPKQQRTVSALTTRAGVNPTVKRVRPLDAHLVEVTGAREPSGEPWFPPREPASRGRSASRWGAKPTTRSDKPRYNDKPRANDRPRQFEDRAPRSFDDRAPRTYEDRAPRTYEDRAPRSYDDRAPRTDRRDDRPERTSAPRSSAARTAAPRAEAGRSSAPRKYDDRAPRKYDDRAPRSFDDRAPRKYDDRAPRKYDDRAPRTSSDRTSSSSHRDDRAPRTYSDRAPSTDRYRDDRAPRTSAPRSDAPRSDRPNRADKPRHSARAKAAAGRPHKADPAKRGSAPSTQGKRRAT